MKATRRIEPLGAASQEPAPERSLDTRKALLLTGERLYACHGIEGVSLREINRAARQKNASAIHYHFGSREAVIEGIFQMRAAQIDTRRRQLLAELRAAKQPPKLRELMEPLLLPQVEVWQEEGTYHYNRFLAQAVLSGHEELRSMWRKYFGDSIGDYTKLMRKSLPEVPAAVFRQRIAVIADFSIYGMARLERIAEERKLANQPFPLQRAIENLIDMLIGALGAAVTEKTQRALARERRRRQ